MITTKKSTTALETALHLRSIGMHPIPIAPNSKRPLIDWKKYQEIQPKEEEIREWFEKWPDANLAIVTGTISGVDVIDFDPGHDDWPPEGYKLPEWHVVDTPRGHHVYIPHIKGLRCSVGIVAKGIDIRAEGGYVLVPPSTIDGKAYKIRCGSPQEVLNHEPPQWLVDALRTGASEPEIDHSTEEMIPDGKRHVTLFKRACSKRAKGYTKTELIKYAEELNEQLCDPPLPKKEAEQQAKGACKYPQGPRRKKRKDISRAEELTRLIEAEVQEFFQDQYGNPCIIVDGENGQVLIPVSKSSLGPRLLKLFRDQFGDVVGSGVVKSTIDQIKAMCFDGPKRELHLRVAWKDEKLYYDLSWPDNRAVEVSADGWRVTPLPPLFKQLPHQTPQVEPVGGGDLSRIWRFLNVSPENRCMMLTVMASYLIPSIAHPILIFSGEPGSGKSTISKMMKTAVDPSPVLSGGVPRKEEDIIMQFDHNWVTCFDNLNRVNTWFSDILCRAATGEGRFNRRLYTDDNAMLRCFRRCIILNGIGTLVKRDDLLDRSVIIGIEKPQRPVAETGLMKEWQQLLPGVLGALFDAVSTGIRNLPSISEEQPFRMADFVRWGKAMALGLGYSAEEFETAYRRSIASKWTESIEMNPFSTAIIDLVNRNGGNWEGTAAELSRALAADIRQMGRDMNLFSLDPRWISEELTRIKPTLEHSGILYTRSSYRKEGGKIQRKIIKLSVKTKEDII